MNPAILKKVKGTMSKYDIDIEDDILKKIIYELKPVYKKYFLTNLPTLKEIDADLANQPKDSFTNGIAVGAKKIIEELEKI